MKVKEGTVPYNPFDKPISDALTPTDLHKLIERQVAEGYFVEYKGEMQSNPKLGKSIAALANTYGGWYIVGVKTDGHNIANDICGFDPATCHDPIAKMRDVVKSHISPTPLFYAQVVVLENRHLVLVVYVPDGQDTPFITSDGRIYRRVHDSSDPVSEHERHAVDRLVDQGREGQRAFARFCHDDRTFSQGEAKKDAGWAAIYLSPYPHGIVEYRSDMQSAAAVEALIKRSQQQTNIPFQSDEGPTLLGTGNVPFTSGYVTHRSIVLRQVDRCAIAHNSLTMELSFEGWAKILVPLKVAEPIIQLDQVAEWVQSEAVRRVLADYVPQDRNTYDIDLIRFIDIQHFWTTIAILVNFYRDWLGEQPMLSDIRIAMELSGIWRSVAFLDDDQWAAQVEKIGMPVVMQNSVTLPPNIEQGALIEYDELLWFRLCQAATSALGLSTEMFARSIIKAGEQSERTVQ